MTIPDPELLARPGNYRDDSRALAGWLEAVLDPHIGFERAGHCPEAYNLAVLFSYLAHECERRKARSCLVRKAFEEEATEQWTAWEAVLNALPAQGWKPNCLKVSRPAYQLAGYLGIADGNVIRSARIADSKLWPFCAKEQPVDVSPSLRVRTDDLLEACLRLCKEFLWNCRPGNEDLLRQFAYLPEMAVLVRGISNEFQAIFEQELEMGSMGDD